MPPLPQRQTPPKRRTEPEVDPASIPVIQRIKPLGGDRWGGLKILIYGDSGTGKTTLWATFPKPILAILCSGGAHSEETDSINTPEYRKTVQEVNLYHPNELQSICDHVEQSGIFKTVVIDHLGGVQDLSIKGILGINRIPEQKGFGFAKQEEWGQCAIECKELLRLTLNLQTHCVWVAGEKVFKPKEDESSSNPDEEITESKLGVALTPSLAKWVQHAVTYQVHTYCRPKMIVKPVEIMEGVTENVEVRVKGRDYMLRVEPDNFYHTKFRVPKGSALRNFQDPDYDKIAALIDGLRQ